MENLFRIDKHVSRIKIPGFLVKTTCKRNHFKFFINICHSTSVGPPTLQLDEKDLRELIEHEKYEELSKFTIPLILEQMQTTKDKKNEEAKMTHAIVNTKFYKEKILTSQVYQNYLVYVVIETINGKFDLRLNTTQFIILKNKKFQPPDGSETFNKFLNDTSQMLLKQKEIKGVDSSLFPYKNNDDKTLNERTSTDFDKPIISDGNQKMQTQNETNIAEDKLKNKNLIVSLDIQNEIVNIKLKLDNNQNLTSNDLKLRMNDDRVIISRGNNINDDIIEEFYLPITMKFEQASCTLIKNHQNHGNDLLSIQCPVLL